MAAAACYRPAAAYAQTGGDWYELVALGGSLVALSVGDVVGTGPRAAAVMGQLRSALASNLLDGHGPAATLERLDAFAARTDGAAGTTCACLTLDWETGELRWAVAGHPPPLVIDGAARLLSGGGRVLGGPDRSSYREWSTTLSPGASVLLYTDGLIERRDEVIDEGLQHLCEAAARLAAVAPEPLVSTITDTLLDGGQTDDVAVLAVRLLPPPLHRRRAAETSVLRQLRADVADWSALTGLSPELHQDLTLGLGEAVANSVEHAYSQRPGNVTYSVTRSAAGELDVLVRDDGTWRPEPTDNGHRGRGLAIIKAMSEDHAIDHDERGTTIRFRLAEDPDQPGRSAQVPFGTMQPATVSVTESATGAVVISVVGDLDLDTIDDTGSAVLRAVEASGAKEFVVDLSELGYLSSCGIALLLDAAALAKTRDTALIVRASTKSAPLRILEMAGLTDASTGFLTIETVSAP
ncbi:SpoIIE family protein phosphatase [Amycolatopsis sp. lyj-23]|uniref:SpoIIE family protein phosphatase n=1 Tax=Amycolatopsis sp. lyj-23 TaxID=2789283 RepID=UPI00397E45FB